MGREKAKITCAFDVMQCVSVWVTVDIMNAKKLLLQTCREIIVKDLHPTDVVDELYSKKVLTEEDANKIKNQVRTLYTCE